MANSLANGDFDLSDAPRPKPRDHVVSTIAEQILSGQLRPGEKLPSESDLADRLAVSRTALRESMRTLVGKGLIVSRSRSGSVVQPVANWNHFDPELLAWREAMAPDMEFVRALNEARQAIEPAAAALAASHATGHDLAAIETAYHAMRETSPQAVDDAVTADEAFHRAILMASHNPFFAAFGSVIGPTMRISFRLTTSASANYTETLDMHGEVAEAIRLRRPDEARDVMTRLLGLALSDLTRVVDRAERV